AAATAQRLSTFADPPDGPKGALLSRRHRHRQRRRTFPSDQKFGFHPLSGSARFARTALGRNRPAGESGVTRTIWLASYPKSGNTWFRMLVANLSAKDKPIDINDLPERGGIASARGPFDHLLLIDSTLLTHDEIDSLRPRVYEELARGTEDDEYDTQEDHLPVRFVKAHDAYTLTSKGEPLLAGRRGADGAIVIVRDPRDVAPSLANHNGSSIDEAISFMNDRSATFCGRSHRLQNQLRQQLPGWSG